MPSPEWAEVGTTFMKWPSLTEVHGGKWGNYILDFYPVYWIFVFFSGILPVFSGFFSGFPNFTVFLDFLSGFPIFIGFRNFTGYLDFYRISGFLSVFRAIFSKNQKSPIFAFSQNIFGPKTANTLTSMGVLFYPRYELPPGSIKSSRENCVHHLYRPNSGR